MNEQQRAVLKAICDTVVPSLERADDPDGFWARSASDVGTPEALEDVIEQTFPDEQREGVGELLDGLAELGFLVSSRRSREPSFRCKRRSTSCSGSASSSRIADGRNLNTGSSTC